MRDSNKINGSRRAFIATGGTALGATLASAAVAGPGLFDTALPLQARLDRLQQQLATLEDHEAIRHLHLAYSALLENQLYDTVVELFADDAQVNLHGETVTGKHSGIRQLFLEQYGCQQAPAMHSAFLQNQAQLHDSINIHGNGQSASATFHTRVLVSRPLPDQSAVGTMAKMQGISASAAWENGRFVVDYAREASGWRINRLQYQRA